MKDQIIKLLAYPRSVLGDLIDMDACPHSGSYYQQDGRCRKCSDAPECQWLSSNDEFVALEQKSTEELLGPLVFAVDFVNLQLAYWGHDRASCDCETCVWVRAAMQVRDEVESGLG